MKINAILYRGSRKDFVDTYVWIHELSFTREQVNRLFQQKFGSFNPLIINKALTYFADADTLPELDMIQSIPWEDVKKFLVKTFARLNP